jgi:hypothetical protein
MFYSVESSMDMSLIVTGEKRAFTTQISDAMKAKCSTQKADKLVIIASIFFEHYPIDELVEHDINLDTNADGWRCKNTVVTVHYNNALFMIDSIRMALTSRALSIKKLTR